MNWFCKLLHCIGRFEFLFPYLKPIYFTIQGSYDQGWIITKVGAFDEKMFGGPCTASKIG